MIVSESTMTTFWSTIYFLAESLLYLIIGFYIGIEAFHVNLGYCFKYAALLWALAQGCRFISIFLCWPILNKLGTPLKWRELTLWGWTGLKSRVCVALIYEFSIHLLDESGPAGEEKKSEVVFIVGVAFMMSTFINGGLCGLVALFLGLDKAGELEDKLKSIFFKYSLYSTLKKDKFLAHHFHHLAEYSITGENGKRSSDSVVNGFTPKPSMLGLDWSKIDRQEVIVTMRAFILTIIKSLYQEENIEHKSSIFAIQGLMASIDKADEDSHTKPLNDFYHLMLMMPSRETKSNHYRVINMLTTMAECHMTAREIFEVDIFNPILKSASEFEPSMVAVLRSAWEEVKEESEKCEKYAKREISVRFSAEVISTYYTLRNLEVNKLHEMMELFSARRMITEKDLEDAQEALHEDMHDIKGEMRNIGEGRSQQNTDGEYVDQGMDDDRHPLMG